MGNSNPGEDGGYGFVPPSAQGDDKRDKRLQRLHDQLDKLEERQKDMVPKGDIRFVLEKMREDKTTARRIGASQVAEVIENWEHELEKLLDGGNPPEPVDMVDSGPEGDGDDSGPPHEVCPKCEGHGGVIGDKCERCDGTGRADGKSNI